MFVPMGGSTPKYAGKDVIKSLAAICAGGMLLDSLGETTAAAVEEAVIWTTTHKVRNLAAGQMGHSTTEVGDLVAARVAG